MNDTRVRHLFPGVRVLAPAAFYRLFGPAEDLGATIHVFLDRIPLREENENGTRALIVGAKCDRYDRKCKSGEIGSARK